MVTLHPAAKKFADGFVPMITLRGDKGQMIGSRTPQGGYREFRTFTNEHECTIEARLIALRIAGQFPDVLRVAF
jgi:hypothetical protein